MSPKETVHTDRNSVSGEKMSSDMRRLGRSIKKVAWACVVLLVFSLIWINFSASNDEDSQATAEKFQKTKNDSDIPILYPSNFNGTSPISALPKKFLLLLPADGTIVTVPIPNGACLTNSEEEKSVKKTYRGGNMNDTDATSFSNMTGMDLYDTIHVRNENDSRCTS